MVKGPAGGPRPFAKHQIVFDPYEMAIYIVNTGPLGGPRPFSKLNPEVEEDRIRECVISSAGSRFGAGSVSAGFTTNLEELSPEQQLEAIRRAEAWCEGILESTSEEDLSAEEINRRFNETVDQILAQVQEESPREPDLFDRPAEEVEIVAVE